MTNNFSIDKTKDIQALLLHPSTLSEFESQCGAVTRSVQTLENIHAFSCEHAL